MNRHHHVDASDRAAATGRTGLRLGLTALIGTFLAIAGSFSMSITSGWVASASAAPSSPAPRAPAGATSGYRLLGGDGGVFAFSAPFYGSAASDPALCPPNTSDREMPNGTCWSMATTPDGGGYWILNASTGVLSTYGDALSFGSPAAQFAGVGRENVPNFIDMASTPDGKGYWVLAEGLSGLGSVEHFGDAGFYGDETTTPGPSGHVGAPVALAATPSGKGYWIVDSDGGVFSFGDAGFYGSMGGTALAAGVVGLAPTLDGRGYWLVGADGGVFSFGDAQFGGSLATVRLNRPIIGISTDPTGTGYWLAAADGGVFALGGAPFEGSLVGTPLVRPIFAINAQPRPTA